MIYKESIKAFCLQMTEMTGDTGDTGWIKFRFGRTNFVRPSNRGTLPDMRAFRTTHEFCVTCLLI